MGVDRENSWHVGPIISGMAGGFTGHRERVARKRSLRPFTCNNGGEETASSGTILSRAKDGRSQF